MILDLVPGRKPREMDHIMALHVFVGLGKATPTCLCCCYGVCSSPMRENILSWQQKAYMEVNMNRSEFKSMVCEFKS